MATQTAKALTPAEEHATRFRPSENFRHMKKYLKSRFENSTINASNDSPQVTNPGSSAHIEGKVKPVTEVQPPLPPYSPPPGVYIKQEIDTTDYQDREPEPCVDFSQPDTVLNTSIAAPKETMSHNFVHGMCENEYKRYQYVHCPVFEQQQFYTTGQLPPHATEHIRHHQQQFQGTMFPEVSDQFHTPPQIVPHHHTSFETSSTMVPVGSTPLTVDRTASTDYWQGYGQGVYQYEPTCSTSSNEQPWTYNTAYSQRDLDFRKSLLKKCNDCDTNEFRYEFYKNKAKEMKIAVDDNEQKLAQLRKKTQRLMEIFEFVGQPVSNLSDINL